MQEIVRYGRFAVIDKGQPGPRYAVLEHDAAGPILRSGPCHILSIAMEAAQALNFRDELKPPSKPPRKARVPKTR
jgi:hypothetical protein